MQQAKVLIDEAVHDLELKMKGELYLMTNEQIALRKDVKTTTDGFADRLTVLENRSDHLEISRDSSSSEPEIAEGSANYLGTLPRDVSKSMDACSETGSKVDLRFTRVANRLRTMEAHMATVAGNVQNHNNNICPQNAEKTKTLCFSQYNDDDSTSNDEDWKNLRQGMNLIARARKKKTLADAPGRKTKTKAFIKQTKYANWKFKKRGPKHSGLKEIRLSNSF